MYYNIITKLLFSKHNYWSGVWDGKLSSKQETVDCKLIFYLKNDESYGVLFYTGYEKTGDKHPLYNGIDELVGLEDISKEHSETNLNGLNFKITFKNVRHSDNRNKHNCVDQEPPIFVFYCENLSSFRRKPGVKVTIQLKKSRMANNDIYQEEEFNGAWYKL